MRSPLPFPSLGSLLVPVDLVHFLVSPLSHLLSRPEPEEPAPEELKQEDAPPQEVIVSLGIYLPAASEDSQF